MASMVRNQEGRIRRYLTQKQIANALGISTQTVRALIERREITAVVISGHTIRVPEEELERLLRSRSIGKELRRAPERRGPRGQFQQAGDSPSPEQEEDEEGPPPDEEGA